MLILRLAATQIVGPTNPPQPIALTVLDVAPPPPPPGPPAAAPVVAPVEPQPVRVAQTVQQPLHEKPREHPKPKIAQKPPRPRPDEPVSPASAPPPAVAATEGATSTGTGIPGGVAGGVENGRVGGIVGGQGDQLYRADQVATVPQPISQLLPEYPPLARARGIEGLVVVEAVVDRGGNIESDSLKVVQSIPALDSSAVAALEHWRFHPGRDRNGATVRVLVQVPIRFRLR